MFWSNIQKVMTHAVGFAIFLVMIVIASMASAETPLEQRDVVVPPRLVVVGERAAKLRTVGILDAIRIDEAFAQGAMSPVFDERLADVSDRAETIALWSAFFRSAQIFLGAGEAVRPVAGFYSPIFDFWLLTFWTMGEVRPRLVETRLVTGESLLAQDNGAQNVIEDRPTWLRLGRTMPYPTALQRQTSSAAKAFDRRFPLAASESSSQSVAATPSMRVVFRNRATAFVLGTSGLREDTQTFALYQGVVKALAVGDRQGLKNLASKDSVSEDIDQILKIPLEHRQPMVQVVAVPTPDGVLVMSNRRDEARFLLLTQFGKGETAYGLVGIGLLDLYAGLAK